MSQGRAALAAISPPGSRNVSARAVTLATGFPHETEEFVNGGRVVTATTGCPHRFRARVMRTDRRGKATQIAKDRSCGINVFCIFAAGGRAVIAARSTTGKAVYAPSFLAVKGSVYAHVTFDFAPVPLLPFPNRCPPRLKFASGLSRSDVPFPDAFCRKNHLPTGGQLSEIRDVIPGPGISGRGYLQQG